MSIWFKEISIKDLEGSSINMDKHLEIEFYDIGTNYLCAKMPVNEKTKQPFGLLHGGASCVLAESVASFATALTLDLSKQIPVGLSLNANHLKSATAGFVFAKATATYRQNNFIVGCSCHK